MKRLLTACLSIALASAAAGGAEARQARPAQSAAEAGRSVPVSRIFSYLDRYYGLPAAQRSRFRLAYALKVNNRPFTGSAWYVSPSGQRTPVPLDANGLIGRLPTLAQLRNEQERFTMDVPSGSRFSMQMQIVPNVPPSTEMDAAALAASVTQVNQALRSAAGLMRFAVPTFTRVVFPGTRGGAAVMADGSTRPLPTAGGAASFTPSEMSGARSVRFDAAPPTVLLAPAARR